MSLLRYIASEVTRSYRLENDQERYTERREKMYTFMRIPRELEKFMSYGFFHCLDSFLFIFTFLPLRVLMACGSLLVRLPCVYLGIMQTANGRLLYPAEIIDLLKCFIIGSCCYAMSYVDTSMLYHIIKSQSVIKLYLMYNMIEMADRLFSAFGQDTIDALFWTATEPRGKKREHIGIIPHVLIAVGYVFLHSMLVLLQATTLNVAINASNKALLTIMMTNNFVELKGSVFKKFDKNNLFQVSCSDVRERFHLFALLFVVVVQTMKEYGWREESFWTLAPDCLLVLGAEILVDWLKHAFITRFNELPADNYKNYTISLAYDLAQTKQEKAFSDHSDVVSRRMGFIPLPLGVVMLRVVYTSVKSTNPGAWAVVVMAYLCLLTFRILGSIVILGKACDLIEEHQGKQEEKKRTSTGTDPGVARDRAREPGVASPAHKTGLLGIRPEVQPLPTAPPAPASPDLFQRPSFPSDPAEHRKLSEITDVILVKMNPEMKEAERLSEEEQGGGRSSRSRSSSFVSSGRVVEVTVRDTIEDIMEAREVATARDTIEDIVNGNADTGMLSSDRLGGVVEEENMSPINHSDTVVENNIVPENNTVPTGMVKRKRSETVAGVTAVNGVMGVGGSEAMGHLSVEAAVGEEESVLRYRSVQRSMSSPDLVLDGLGEWREGRRGEGGGEE